MMKNFLQKDLFGKFGVGLKDSLGVILDRRRDQKVQKEIDFVVNQGDKKAYIQFACEMPHTEKEASELDSLRLTNLYVRPETGQASGNVDSF